LEKSLSRGVGFVRCQPFLKALTKNFREGCQQPRSDQ
jgi:hypothetical protein